jgi:hypothetical protein
MILADAFQIVDTKTGGFYQTGVEWIEDPNPSPYPPEAERGRNIGDVPATHSPSRWRSIAWFEDEQEKAGVWTEAQVDRFIGERRPPELAHLELLKVPAPACGCCGKRPPAVKLKALYGPRRHPAYRAWRCEKHEGRNPCIIPGCGKTWAVDEDGYEVSMICGTHWRMGPKPLRDRVAAIRKRANRLGWDDVLSGRHHRLWHRVVREIRRRLEPAAPGEVVRGDIREISAELERLGL